MEWRRKWIYKYHEHQNYYLIRSTNCEILPNTALFFPFFFFLRCWLFFFIFVFRLNYKRTQNEWFSDYYLCFWPHLCIEKLKFTNSRKSLKHNFCILAIRRASLDWLSWHMLFYYLPSEILFGLTDIRFILYTHAHWRLYTKHQNQNNALFLALHLFSFFHYILCD